MKMKKFRREVKNLMTIEIYLHILSWKILVTGLFEVLITVFKWMMGFVRLDWRKGWIVNEDGVWIMKFSKNQGWFREIFVFRRLN